MYIVNGYQSEGVIDKDSKTGLPINPPISYDNMMIEVFADEWPDQAGGHKGGNYPKFGQPTEFLKIPTGMFIDVLGIPYRAGETTRDILFRFDLESLCGSEILPVYDKKGKIKTFSISYAAPAPAEKDIKVDKK